MGRATGLAQEQSRALAALTEIAALDGFYLAGGSALAFHLRHRRSNDLDLFSAAGLTDLAPVAAELDATGRVTRLAATDAVLKVRMGRVAVDIVSYRYPPLERPKPGPGGFPIAGLLDIAVMKLSAISTRGIYRDFWDLHEILTRSGVTLVRACDGYLRRFGVKRDDLYHVLRSLTYFDDAEKEELPPRLSQRHWNAIKAYFIDQAPKALAKRC